MIRCNRPRAGDVDVFRCVSVDFTFTEPFLTPPPLALHTHTFINTHTHIHTHTGKMSAVR